MSVMRVIKVYATVRATESVTSNGCGDEGGGGEWYGR
jgi:hypothetical protein